MNARQRKKQYKMEIKRLNLLPNEFLVFRFEPDQWCPETMEKFAEYVRDKVSTKIVFVSKDIEMIVVADKT
jgi:hypothetical protein